MKDKVTKLENEAKREGKDKSFPYTALGFV